MKNLDILRQLSCNDKILMMASNGLKYVLVYTTGGQRFTIKNNIEDEGYASYLFDKLAQDLNLNKDIDEKTYDIKELEDKVNKCIINVIKDRGGDNQSKVKRRSYGMQKLIDLQSKITNILLKDYGVCDISDESIDKFIDSQRVIRDCLTTSDYEDTSCGSVLNKYFNKIDNLKNEKNKLKCKQVNDDTISLFDVEIKRVEDDLRSKVKELMNVI